MSKKIMGLLLLVVVVIIVIVIIFVVKNNKAGKTQEPVDNTVKEEFVTVLDNGIKINTSNTLSKRKKVTGLNGLEISNIQLTYNGQVTNVLANVKNTTNSEILETDLILKFYDKENNLVLKLPGIIEKIPAAETKQLNTNVTADFANIYDFTVEVQK